MLIDGTRKDLFDAYDEFSKAIKNGQLSSLSEGGAAEPKKRGRSKAGEDASGYRKRARGRTTRVQSEREIRLLIEDGGASVEELPDTVKSLISIGRDRLVKYKYMPATDTVYGCDLSEVKLPNRLIEYLRKKGFSRLYAFQEQSFNAILEDKNVVIAAPTAQGKTEAFILPIIRRLLLSVQESFMNPGIRALLVYPTKALARDQYEKITQMCEASGLVAGIFDGDVSQAQRAKLYERPPDILITNPDVLHYHLGWDRSRLVPLLNTVEYVVLDEIHLYTGSTGANLYYILKRLELEAGSFQKIGASATIANPKEFAEQVFDTNVELIVSESAKRGPIHFLMFYPDERSKYSMIVDLVKRLQSGGFKTLVFGNTHSEAEVLNMLLKDTGLKSMVHRAGLSRKYRNQVELQFKTGNLPILVSTPTLELGIDIGDLDSVVSMIVSITRLTQRIGRAGRKGQESIAVLALRENDPISSFYRHQPDKYFTDIDSAYMEPGNEVVGRFQFIAAAMSGKLNESFLPKQSGILDSLVKDGLLKVMPDGNVRVVDFETAMSEWRGYSIRGIGDTVEIKLGEISLGERSMPMAAQELHPGAIYLHGGKNFMSIDFRYRPGFGSATVVPLDDRSVHTKPIYSTMPRIMNVLEETTALGLNVVYCSLEMTQTVYGYVKRLTRTGAVVSRSDLAAPLEYRYVTRGFAFTAPCPVNVVNDYIEGKLKQVKGPQMTPGTLFGGAFHALEHVIIESSDMLTGGSTREIGGVSMGDSGIIFVYDGSPGGNGASKLLFTRLEEAFNRCKTILEKCDCNTIDGCPLCTYSYQCGNNNSPLFKLGALASIDLVLKKAKTEVDTKGYASYEPLV
ncbi:MAG: DEAD/DEAH box helicase [Candidatus Thorarchaeota archaeon]|nr:DEAD/DEAH box helicase [Candidatus Thorarchaeota archaeon]